MNKLTVAEHVALGNALKVAYRATLDVRTAFPSTSRIARAAERMQTALGTLQSQLDTDVCALVPLSADPRKMATKVYYGPPFIESHGDDPNDAFAAWERMEVRR